MNTNTKFVRQLKKLIFLIKKKIKVFQTNVIFSVFSLFLGFVFGNLFGTLLVFFRHFINWDVLIITSTILIVEFINYLNYNNKKNQQIEKTLSLTLQSCGENSKKNRDLKTKKTKWGVKISNFVSNCFYILEKRYQNADDFTFFDRDRKVLTQENRFYVSCKTPNLDEIKKQINFIKILNFYKIGLLLGFFIDAFKVGS
uniref:Ycf20 n=1 Tax=Tupiella akineta TaxID=160070 RepID=Q3ZJ02_TUPAK|nr:hypothetical protein RF20 [Tupiella akineta]AAV80687.1 hypothetical protein RF20 [Tupiella akineta]